MTVLEKKKFKLIRAIMDDTDENRVAEIERMYKNQEKQYLPEPCMYTIEEIQAGLPERIKALEEGKGIPHESIKRKVVS